MFSSADDVARLCRMLLNGGALDGRRFLKAETVKLMWTPWPRDDSPRALGMGHLVRILADVRAVLPDVGGRAPRLHRDDGLARSPDAHLPRAAHEPRAPKWRWRRKDPGAPDSRGGRGRATLFGGARPWRRRASRVTPPPTRARRRDPVRTGLDVLVSQRFAPLVGHTVGLITNATGVDAAVAGTSTCSPALPA
jgi:CubicO group peptidase (beta-lactamase class C family)